MSGRILADHVIEALYRAAADNRLAWLDELLIAAGYRRRCPCEAMAPADESCPQCGAGTEDFFGIHHIRPEAGWAIAATDGSEPTMQILIAAAGGGAIGDAHAHRNWIYSVFSATRCGCPAQICAPATSLRHTGRWLSCWRFGWLIGPVCPRDGGSGGLRGRRRGRPVMPDLGEIITDGRYPGWRVRLVHDEHAGQPWGDALAPALLVWRGQPATLAADVFVPRHAHEIVHAHGRYADPVLFERYLRIVHGATAIATVEDRDLTVWIFDTSEFRAHIGHTGPVDLAGEHAQWRAWTEGEVYGVVVERRHSGATVWDCQRRWHRRRRTVVPDRQPVGPVRPRLRHRDRRRPAHRPHH